MQDKGKYYITTAIAYTSGKPHIGNTYEIILADCIARYKRADGFDVRFMTGSDEHGQKIESRAARAGKSPKAFVDEVAGEIKRLWDLVGTSYDRFIRTTDPDHERQIQKIFKKLYDQGDIYLGHYSGMYCQECEAFYTPSQIEEEGKCPVCGSLVHEAQEDAYFFRMKKYADKLIEHINTHPEFIQPVSRKNEMMNNFLLPGLQDLCVSRSSFTWGIPVDFAPGHVVYVWLDALSNYITGLGYDADGNSDPLFDKYWPADLHLIGKDIVRFHTIYWPIFLMALGVELPKQVFGHPWLLQGGEKMSKTKGNVIYADDLVDIFGVDATRYFVVHEMPYENDGVITWELVAERVNTDLANTFDATQKAQLLRSGTTALPTLEDGDPMRTEKVLHLNFGANGKESYVSMPNPLYGKTLEKGAAISFWVKRTDDNLWDDLFAFVNGNARFFMTGNVYLGYNDGAGKWLDINQSDSKKTDYLAVGKWQHVTISVSRTDGIRIFINGGTNKTSNVYNGAIDGTNITTKAGFDYNYIVDHLVASPDLFLGKGSFWGSADARFDDVIIYDKPLDYTENTALNAMVSRVFDFGSLVDTGIDEIANSQQPTADGQYYDLQGRRVVGQPHRGIYIVNGKKVMVKD